MLSCCYLVAISFLIVAHPLELFVVARGRIRVDADSVQRVFDLPNRGQKVSYKVDKDTTRRFRETFNIIGTSHPQISTWTKMIEDMAGRTDDTFFMAWLAVAFSTFLAPTTALKLSPKCYGLVLDHEMIKNTNICLFVAEHINEAFRNMDQEKQTVCCCLYHLMILYLDALVHDIPVSNCAVRSNAWDSALIVKVIKKDTISPGVFGKLQLKEEYRGTEQTPLFGGILQAEAFMASKLPITYNPQKKAKIAKVVNDLCKAVTEHVGTFIEAVAKIDDEEPDIDPYSSHQCKPGRHAVLQKERDGEDEEDKQEEDKGEEEEEEKEDSEAEEEEEEGEAEEEDGTKAQQLMAVRGKKTMIKKTRTVMVMMLGDPMEVATSAMMMMMKTPLVLVDLPKSKKNDEAESQGSIDTFKLCNLKLALATTFLVPDFSDQDMCEKINFAIDKSLFLSSVAEKNQVDMEEAGKDLSSGRSKAESMANPHVVQKRKAVSLKKNLQLPQTKEKMVSADAEVNMVKEAVLQTDTSTIVSREPTTITGVQQIKGKTPLSIVPPKPPKQQKIVKFARGTKGEHATKGLGFRDEREPRAKAIDAGVPSSARLLPTQTGKMPTRDTNVPTDVSASSVITVKTTTAAQEGTTATASPKVPTHRDASMPNTKGGDPTTKLPSPRASTQQPSKPASPRSDFQQPLTQAEVFNNISRCKPPRPPTTTLLRTKLVNDAHVFVPQGDALVLEPIQRSKSYHGDGVCDAPSFDLGIDGHAPAPGPAAETAEAGVIRIDEFELDPAAMNEGCAATDAGTAIAQELDVGSPENCHTPICAEPEAGTSSSLGPPIARRQRRVIRPAASQRSPFIDYNKKKTFSSNEAVNKLYTALLYWVRHHEGENDEATSPEIIRYGAFYISLKELVDSMKLVQWLSKIVIETGILHIMDNLPEGSKKVVMPLRFSMNLQQGIHNVKEINKKFDYKNRLNKKDLVMLPVLECTDVTDKEGGRHYWVFNVNLRDGRFEVLDSSRTLDDIELMTTASTIVGAVRQLWRKHYPKFSIEHFQIIDIAVPKQLGNNECGLFALLNATEWNGSQLPNYDPKEVLNIRKKLAYDWVTSTHNTAPWRKLLRYEKD
ncbi:unnamed protein product [Triticum turgidum subsp. durum]|uniref:Ubiquitin-like protease family profile domain-containing protein n=1 Tax=Triticum turgidum subsp. durum TaxID=4567 RepID=A0A9R1RYA0_TRITD|nr:unnamed protein product [Triticum turgidum subsp. durum]